MRTDDLIQALVADRTSREGPVARRLAVMVAIGVLVSLALYAAILAPRDLAAAVLMPRFAFKLAVTLLLAAGAAPLLTRLARPDGVPGILALGLLLAPLLLAVGIGIELIVLDPSEWRVRLVGDNAVACLLCIPLLSLPVLTATLTALRHGAPTRPRFAGVVAGLFAGGLGAFLYATHCPDDSPLFVAAWYPLAIAAVVAMGCVLANRVLRW